MDFHYTLHLVNMHKKPPCILGLKDPTVLLDATCSFFFFCVWNNVRFLLWYIYCNTLENSLEINGRHTRLWTSHLSSSLTSTLNLKCEGIIHVQSLLKIYTTPTCCYFISFSQRNRCSPVILEFRQQNGLRFQNRILKCYKHLQDLALAQRHLSHLIA